MIGVGLSVGLAGAPQSGGAAEPNPNLLLWSEALNNAAWVASGATVTANAANDPDGLPTAERVAYDAEGSLSQTTDVLVAAGDPASATKLAGAALERHDITGTFDGAPYRFSVYAKGADANFSMALFRSGGALVVRLSNPDDGGGIDVDFAWTKLETPTLTAYVKREGT